MANWILTLDIKKEWEQAKNNQCTPAQIAKVIADKLSQLKIPEQYKKWDEQRDSLVRLFQDHSELFYATLDELKDDPQAFEDEWLEFNVTMSMLYDWGDIVVENMPHVLGRTNLCFIKTF